MSAAGFIFKLSTWRFAHLGSLFLLNIAMARYAGPEISGTLFYLTNILAFFSLAANGEWNKGIFRFSKESETFAGEFTFFSVIFSLFGAMVFSALAFLFLFFNSHSFAEISGVHLYLWGFIFIGGTNLHLNLSGISILKKRMIWPYAFAVVINLVAIVLFHAEMLPEKYRQQYGFLSVCFLILSLPGFLLLFFTKLKPFRPSASPEIFRFIKKTLHFSYQYLLANLIFFMVARIEILFVQRYCTPEETGNYLQSLRFMQVMVIGAGTIILSMFNQQAMEKNNLYKERYLSMRSITWWVSLVLMMVGIINLLTRSIAVSVLLGEEYAQAPLFFNIHFFTGSIMVASSLLTSWLLLNSKPVYLIIASAIALIYILISNAVWVPTHGPTAAAWNGLIGHSLECLVVLFFFRRKGKEISRSL